MRMELQLSRMITTGTHEEFRLASRPPHPLMQGFAVTEEQPFDGESRVGVHQDFGGRRRRPPAICGELVQIFAVDPCLLMQTVKHARSIRLDEGV